MCDMKAHQPLKRCLNQTLRCLYRENLYELKLEVNRKRVDVVNLQIPGYRMTQNFPQYQGSNISASTEYESEGFAAGKVNEA